MMRSMMQTIMPKVFTFMFKHSLNILKQQRQGKDLSMQHDMNIIAMSKCVYKYIERYTCVYINIFMQHKNKLGNKKQVKNNVRNQKAF